MIAKCNFHDEKTYTFECYFTIYLHYYQVFMIGSNGELLSLVLA